MGNKRNNLTICIILSLLVLLFLVWDRQPKTPLAALEKGYIGKNESILRYSELIEQIDINSDESLLFYFNGNGNMNCAVVEKKFVGYKVVDVNAELQPHHEERKVGLYGSSYNRGRKWIYFGVIYDDSVEKVVWNDVDAIRFSSSNLDILYAFGDGEFKGKEYYLYDSNDNKLED